MCEYPPPLLSLPPLSTLLIGVGLAALVTDFPRSPHSVTSFCSVNVAKALRRVYGMISDSQLKQASYIISRANIILVAVMFILIYM